MPAAPLQRPTSGQRFAVSITFAPWARNRTDSSPKSNLQSSLMLPFLRCRKKFRNVTILSLAPAWCKTCVSITTVIKSWYFGQLCRVPSHNDMYVWPKSLSSSGLSSADLAPSAIPSERVTPQSGAPCSSQCSLASRWMLEKKQERYNSQTHLK